MHLASRGGRQPVRAAVTAICRGAQHHGAGGCAVARAAVPDDAQEGSAPAGAVTRKELGRVFRDAQEALRLRPSLRLVLGELVASWGEQAWDRLIVWPSNAHLARRTGLSERGLRVAFRSLAELGLIAPKDSPNGKRYPVRDGAGDIVDAYGFDLTPLFRRRATWAEKVAAQRAEARLVKQLHDEITIARRAAGEMLDAMAALPGGAPEAMVAAFEVLAARTPRRGTAAPADGLLADWMALRERVEDAFAAAASPSVAALGCEMGGRQGGDTSDDTTGEVSDDRAGDRTGGGDRAVERSGDGAATARSGPAGERHAGGRLSSSAANGGTACRHKESQNESFRRTCQSRDGLERHAPPPEIGIACPVVARTGLRLERASDAVPVAHRLRLMLGASEEVWKEATHTLGTMKAALTVIYVAQLYEDDTRRRGGESRIRNPGGYLRACTRMVAAGRIDLAAELTALERRHTRAALVS